MEALQQTVGGLPASDLTKKTFAQAVLSTPVLPPHNPSSDPNSHLHANPIQATPGMHKGFPSISFSDTHTLDLSQSFSRTLIGKFSQGYNKQDPKLGRPSVDDLHKYFLAMDFRGTFHLGLLDNRHLLIQFQCDEDYLRMYSRQVWYIRAVTMRIFKWSPYFRVDKESSVVPIWLAFPRLPVHLFRKDALFSIAQLLGQPLRLDEATTKLKRPSTARIQVELDVLKERPLKIWIQMGEREGFWQTVEYENVPPYCCHCWHLGHHETQCHVQNPDLKTDKAVQPRADARKPKQPKPAQQYVVKQTATIPPEQPQSSSLTVAKKSVVPTGITTPDKGTHYVSLTSPSMALHVSSHNPIPHVESDLPLTSMSPQHAPAVPAAAHLTPTRAILQTAHHTSLEDLSLTRSVSHIWSWLNLMRWLWWTRTQPWRILI